MSEGTLAGDFLRRPLGRTGEAILGPSLLGVFDRPERRAPADFPEVQEAVQEFPVIEFPAFPEPPPPPPAPTPPPPTTGEAARLVGVTETAARRRRRARFRVGRAQTILTGPAGATGGVAVKRLLGE